ncbi:MAG TPA: hypothetical protein VNU97_17435 [Rhizomicrobium sp.]|jgi:hypothetical protein|nr:hypothetical protein [Rhizomicrobium sp.]
MTAEVHYQKSSLREKIIEHVFIGEALRMLWRKDIVDVEILRSEFDAFGYDLVVERGGITRHVQLKAGIGVPSNIGVSEALMRKRSGCVIYVQISDGLDLGPYYWFGDPDTPLSSIMTYPLLKRTTPNSAGIRPERKGHRNVARKAFNGPFDLQQILAKLLEL